MAAPTELELSEADEDDSAEQLDLETDAEALEEDVPGTTLTESDAPDAATEEMDDDSTSDTAADATDQADNVIALTKPVSDDPAPPRRRGGLATALIGASAIAATLAIAPQYVPMDSLQHLQPVQDLLHQLSQLKQFLA